MFAYLTPRQLACSPARRKRRVSVWVLVWICLSQFPLPVAHAHANVADDDVQLAAHIESKHSAEDGDTLGLHWHLVMPWESDDQESEDPPRHHPSPLGLWGAEGNVLPQSESVLAHQLTVLERVLCDWGDNFTHPSATRLGDRVQASAANFSQTYLGVSLCTLVCVSLR